MCAIGRYGLTATRKRPDQVCGVRRARLRSTHVDLIALEPLAEVVHDRRLVEMRQVGDVLDAFKLHGQTMRLLGRRT